PGPLRPRRPPPPLPLRPRRRPRPGLRAGGTRPPPSGADEPCSRARGALPGHVREVSRGRFHGNPWGGHHVRGAMRRPFFIPRPAERVSAERGGVIVPQACG